MFGVRGSDAIFALKIRRGQIILVHVVSSCCWLWIPSPFWRSCACGKFSKMLINDLGVDVVLDIIIPSFPLNKFC